MAVLAFCFIVIVFTTVFKWLAESGRQDAMEWEFGYGQLLNADYNPYDVFSIKDGHGSLSEEKTENLTPVLVRQASVYPNGRMNPVLLRGIAADQLVLKLPIKLLAQSDAEIPVLIGSRMAENLKLKKDDQLVLDGETKWYLRCGKYNCCCHF